MTWTWALLIIAASIFTAWVYFKAGYAKGFNVGYTKGAEDAVPAIMELVDKAIQKGELEGDKRWDELKLKRAER